MNYFRGQKCDYRVVRGIFQDFGNSLPFAAEFSRENMTKISNFHHYYDFSPIFRFLTKFSIFEQNFIYFEQNFIYFEQYFIFLNKISFFEQNFICWTKFNFLKIISFLVKIWWKNRFWVFDQKLRILTKISSFGC